MILALLVSGCAEKETKYVNSENSEKYIVFSNDEKHTAFYHSGGTENAKGTWTETEDEYTFWIDDDNGGNVIFKKLKDGNIGLVYDNEGNYAVYKKV
ncbi:hypothetical protein MSWHS_2674 [Methanosarcina sp. WWM596]|nr:hypothetical protein MSWHS_2674 [Methanosarcina sp. WWM596]